MDGIATSQLPSAWSVTDEDAFSLFRRETNKEFPAPPSIGGTKPRVLNAGEDQSADRALAIHLPARSPTGETIQFLADTPATDANAFQLAFDIEAWDAGRVTALGEAAFDATIEVDSGAGFSLLADLGRVTTGEVLDPPSGAFLNGNLDANRISYDSGLIEASIPANSRLRLQWAASDGATGGWVFGLDNVSFTLLGDEIQLGDMNLDDDVNGLDVDPFVHALLSGPYQPEADMNDDQVVNGLDVDPFVAALVGGGTQQIPEPSTLLLSIVALSVVGGWRV
jgi:hypothetical protein